MPLVVALVMKPQNPHPGLLTRTSLLADLVTCDENMLAVANMAAMLTAREIR
jgi:hypothetical protein